MKKAGNLIATIGATLFFLSSCYLDSESYIFLLIAFVGLALLCVGYRMGGKHGGF